MYFVFSKVLSEIISRNKLLFIQDLYLRRTENDHGQTDITKVIHSRT